ncbi:hypothetical protein Syun_017241 [Stephania yunnanensis]|uniref:DYW domain-containing protein n=1 Tax=Stephania yunnanensis TaxID=152371 RepID=A0AAP0J6K1_9MAGN
MPPTTISLFGSSSNSFISQFQRRITEQVALKSVVKLQKLFVGNVGIRTPARFSSSALCCALEEFSDGLMDQNAVEGARKEDGLAILRLIEERGLRADCNTYFWLLEGCLSFGSLTDVRKIHGRLLKISFEGESQLYDKLIDVYAGLGDFNDAVTMLNKMPERNVSSWNNVISGLVGKKSYRMVFKVFSRMIADDTNPNDATFASVLRACSYGNLPFHFVEQVQAKIIQCGFSADQIVCNPLIDLYAKNGYVNAAQSIFGELCSLDNVSWVAMISGFCQNGREVEALQLFYEMRELGVVPTPYIFSSVLSACAKVEFYEEGKQVHALVFKYGFSSETFVCNALVTLHSRCGNLISAERIFNGMNSHDRVTYNSLISGLAQHGYSNKAFELFDKMQLSGLKPDRVTVASLLSACASVEALHKGMQLHSFAIKTGISSDIIIEGSLLDLYSKCSDVETALEFFNTTKKENVVLWNVMLVAYGQWGDLSKSIEIFCKMQAAGMRPNQYTYPCILRTCTSSGALDLGEQVHTHIVKTGFDQNVYVCSILIDMYAKHRRLETARDILEKLAVEDVVSWTAMIAGYVQQELCAEALRLFEDMRIRGIRSDNIGFSSALSACAGIQALNQGRQLQAQSYVSGYSTDLSVGNSLINLYAKCGRIEEAYLAFEMIQTKSQISWNGLISGFAQSGNHEEAMLVFSWMNHQGLDGNLFTFCSVVSASANMADIKQGKQIHAKMIKTGYDSEIEAGNALISLYAKCGSINDAKIEFLEMHERNKVSWNAMITGLSQNGCGPEALELFEEMQQQGMTPNHVTFVGVLSACSHVGLVSKGLRFLKSMNEEHGIAPKPEHYACVVDILGRAGKLELAKEFIEEMPILPDAMVWRTLLSACAVHKNMEIGEYSGQHLLELEPLDSASYVLLSNIYAVTKKWECRDQVRMMMKERGVKKEPGQSWIEVKNVVHAFFVGDRLHPLSGKIYDFLEDLNERLSEIGYIQDRNSLLTDIEQERKDPTAYIHSEKLAITFGLISLSPVLPVRVIKNLRICNDCHNWIKLVSKLSERTLVVRDAYRFHHFEGGRCSCADYW